MLLPLFPSAASSLAFPHLRVEVAFDTSPFAVNPSWTDVTEFVRQISTNRGRSRELDRQQPGRLSLVLDNRDRRFDPRHSSGPHFGKILPMKKIRVRATFDTTADLFVGFIDSWEQRYDNPKEATCVVQATDGFKALSKAEFLSSAYAETVDLDAPVAWWRLGEPAKSAVAFDSSGNNHHLTYHGTPTLGATGLPANESDTSMQIVTAKTDGAGGDEGVLAGGPLTVEFIINGGATGGFIIGQATPDSPSTGFAVDIQGFGNVVAFVIATTPGAGLKAESGTFTTNATHHIVCVWDNGGSFRIYIDGTLNMAVNQILALGSFASGQQMLLGGGPFGAIVENGFVGRIDEVALYDYAFAQADVTRHHLAYLEAWAFDGSGARVTRVLDAIGWPSPDRDVDTGSSTLLDAQLTGSALDHLQTVNDTEGGLLYVRGDGALVFRGRKEGWSSPAVSSEATFSDATTVRYADIVFELSDQLIRNPVTLVQQDGPTGLDGLSHTVKDDDGIRDFLPQGYSLNVITSSQPEVVDHANYLLAQHKGALNRASGLRIFPQRNSTVIFPKLLALDLGDRITVVRTPQGVGSAITTVQVVEGISHTIGIKTWETTLMVSPGDAAEALILDDAVSGILDTNLLGW